jgi:hypothetical protein
MLELLSPRGRPLAGVLSVALGTPTGARFGESAAGEKVDGGGASGVS